MSTGIGLFDTSPFCGKTMEGTAEVGEYKPTADFEEFNRDFDINLTDASELWLIQWPLNSTPDINGQAISLKLHNDGGLGTFEASSGKQYEVVSYKSQEPEATVFLPSSSECKIVGKISRQVSIVHYPEPREISESNRSVFKKMAERSASSLTNSANRYSTPTQGIRSRNSGSRSGYTSSILSGRNGNVASGSGDNSKVPLRRHADEPIRSIDLSLQDSGREHSAITSSGSLEQSQERKSKKRQKSEV